MNKQEIYNTVRDHLLKQNAKSTKEYIRPIEDYKVSVCAYRGDNGLKCAIGCLIPDEKYDPFMENNTIKSLIDKLEVLDWTIEDADFLQGLQDVHDTNEVRNWPKNLEVFARMNNLQP